MSLHDDEAELLVRGAAALGAPLEPASAALLLRFLDRVYAWNRSAGLTTVARPDSVRLHLLDSLSIARFVHPQGSIADLGAGAGLPGIPVSVALPGARVTLVETRRKKASFLAETIRELGLRNCRVLQADAHTLAAAGHIFDAVTARAFLSPPELLRCAAPLIEPGGRVIVMCARRDVNLDETTTDDLVQSADERVVLAGGDEQRRILVFQKPESS